MSVPAGTFWRLRLHGSRFPARNSRHPNKLGPQGFFPTKPGKRIETGDRAAPVRKRTRRPRFLTEAARWTNR